MLQDILTILSKGVINIPQVLHIILLLKCSMKITVKIHQIDEVINFDVIMTFFIGQYDVNDGCLQ